MSQSYREHDCHIFATDFVPENVYAAYLAQILLLLLPIFSGKTSKMLLGCSKGEFGQWLTSEYADIEYVIGQLDWHSFPLGIQQILTTIIINAQQPVNIECFGSTSTNRESFQKVSVT